MAATSLCMYNDQAFYKGGVAMVNLPIGTVMSNLRSSIVELRDSL